MKRGHLIFGALIFLLMLLLPALAVGGSAQSPDSAAIPHSAGDTDTAGFRLLFPDKTVKEVSEHDYVFGVVAAEMSMSAPDEALKAQAVATYTFACRKREDRRISKPDELSGADLFADSSVDQAFLTRSEALEKWGDRAGEYESRLDGIVESVSGITVRYGGDYAETVYHAISGGRTESAQTVWGEAVPYLVPVQSVGDLLAGDYCSSASFSKDEFISRLREAVGSEEFLPSDVEIGEKQCSDSGTVISFTLCGKSFSGKELREIFGLRSANFDIAFDGETVGFTVRGWGHLVGMSQHGAEVMAEQGNSFREILLWYYPGCDIV